MLMITPDAADAVRVLVAHMDVDDNDSGLRISARAAAEQSSFVQFSVVNGPEARDEEVGANGAHVFLEPVVIERLEDKVLDAHVEKGRVRFLLKDRGPDSDATA